MSTTEKNKRDAIQPANKQDWSAVIGKHSQMMALEPRFMFDAAVADAAALVEQNQNNAPDAFAAGETTGGAGEGDAGSANAPGAENTDPFGNGAGAGLSGDSESGSGAVRPHDYLDQNNDENDHSGFRALGSESEYLPTAIRCLNWRTRRCPFSIPANSTSATKSRSSTTRGRPATSTR